MFNRYKTYFLIVMFVFLCLVSANGLSFGFSTPITLDARDNAGYYPGQQAFLQFLGGDKNYYVGPTTDPEWTYYYHHYDGDPHSVDTYAYNKSIPSPWRLESAGNIWSTDKVVGESINNLHAGTYRVSPDSGYFMYSFEDNEEYAGRYWWQLSILAHNVYVNGVLLSDYSVILGSTNSCSSPEDALNAVKNNYLDFNLAEGGSLSFWIWDWNLKENYGNSIDNSGYLTFNVTSVPEPSTLLLLAIGLSFLIRRGRN